jgi:hypothetical protein
MGTRTRNSGATRGASREAALLAAWGSGHPLGQADQQTLQNLMDDAITEPAEALRARDPEARSALLARFHATLKSDLWLLARIERCVCERDLPSVLFSVCRAGLDGAVPPAILRWAAGFEAREDGLQLSREWVAKRLDQHADALAQKVEDVKEAQAGTGDRGRVLFAALEAFRIGRASPLQETLVFAAVCAARVRGSGHLRANHFRTRKDAGRIYNERLEFLGARRTSSSPDDTRKYGELRWLAKVLGEENTFAHVLFLFGDPREWLRDLSPVGWTALTAGPVAGGIALYLLLRSCTPSPPIAAAGAPPGSPEPPAFAASGPHRGAPENPAAARAEVTGASPPALRGNSGRSQEPAATAPRLSVPRQMMLGREVVGAASNSQSGSLAYVRDLLARGSGPSTTLYACDTRSVGLFLSESSDICGKECTTMWCGPVTLRASLEPPSTGDLALCCDCPVIRLISPFWDPTNGLPPPFDPSTAAPWEISITCRLRNRSAGVALLYGLNWFSGTTVALDVSSPDFDFTAKPRDEAGQRSHAVLLLPGETDVVSGIYIESSARFPNDQPTVRLSGAARCDLGGVSGEPLPPLFQTFACDATIERPGASGRYVTTEKRKLDCR